MSPLEYTRARLRAVISEITRLKESEFPHPHSKEALEVLERTFGERVAILDSLSTTTHSKPVIQNACSETTQHIAGNLPYLGFILRSTNVRNAFEIYAPVLRLAQKILGPDIKLLLSSEWEFSPFVYKSIPSLPDFVLIGQPAPESGNPLLTPLAGHEIGHTVWNRKKLGEKFTAVIEQEIYSAILKNLAEFSNQYNYPLKDEATVRSDLFVAQKVAIIHSLSMSQAEESFCDFLGIQLFGEAFLHAFAYLLAPGSVGRRPLMYPNMTTRVANMVTASTNYGFVAPADYVNWFVDKSPPTDKELSLLVRLADTVLVEILSDLISTAREIVRTADTPVASVNDVDRIFSFFNELIPASNAKSLSNILNAAWRGYHDSKLWERFPRIKSRETTLSELVLKSIEVFEYETKMTESKATHTTS